MNTITRGLQQSIRVLEERILRKPQVDCPMMHWIEGQYYYRAILVKAGTLITGAKHRLEHECISIGDISVSTDLGMKRLTGYHRFWAEAEKKRIGLALQDTIWVTVHWTSQQTTDKIEEWLSFPEEHAALNRVRERQNNQGRLQQSNLTQLIEEPEVQL